MSHPEGSRLLALAEGRLPADEAHAVRAHALGCAACRRDLAAIRPTAVFALLGGARPAPLDADAFRARLRRALREGAAVPVPARPFRASWHRPAAVLAAAAALAVAALVPVIGTGDFVVRYAEQHRILPVTPVEDDVLPAELLVALEGLEEWAPAVEGIESDTAEFFELASLTDEGMQLVLIVDEDLEL